MSTEEKQNDLLTGIRILDLADETAVTCTKLLADLGARVIKVEKPGSDAARKSGPFLESSPPQEHSLSFCYNNTNKLGITLNLEHPEGKNIFLRLVKQYDVVVESFQPGYLDDLGLGFDALCRAHYEIILASITGFGQTGPRKAYKSCDLVASAVGGRMFVTGSPDSVPLNIFGEQSFFTASLNGAIGILLALRRRSQRKKGEHIDISLQEAVTSTLENVLVRYFYDGVVPQREGNLHWNRLFCILPCRDGFIQVTLFHQWGTLVEWMAEDGMAEDLGDEKWEDEDYRLDHIDHVIEVMGRWTRTRKTHELFETGQLMHFPWAPVQSPQDLLSNPQFNDRDFFVEVDHPEINRTIKYPGLPYQFSSVFPTSVKRAPFIGENNKQILSEELGISDDELRRLSSEGVI
ncbi:CaiB/BaiF CoA transferase family protein [Thermodesulfobacteriota bacterium]